MLCYRKSDFPLRSGIDMLQLCHRPRDEEPKASHQLSTQLKLLNPHTNSFQKLGERYRKQLHRVRCAYVGRPRTSYANAPGQHNILAPNRLTVECHMPLHNPRLRRVHWISFVVIGLLVRVLYVSLAVRSLRRVHWVSFVIL